mmetsp:Transcript_36551/g.108580  ORF Transcript_36551/g.108580 Transcript_36551/m.108580 type:complete len:276 (+) Transcript_36551:1643-2470(+)
MANELTAGRAHVSLTTSSLNANFSHRTSSRARSDQVAQSNSTSRAWTGAARSRRGSRRSTQSSSCSNSLFVLVLCISGCAASTRAISASGASASLMCAALSAVRALASVPETTLGGGDARRRLSGSHAAMPTWDSTFCGQRAAKASSTASARAGVAHVSPSSSSATRACSRSSHSLAAEAAGSEASKKDHELAASTARSHQVTTCSAVQSLTSQRVRNCSSCCVLVASRLSSCASAHACSRSWKPRLTRKLSTGRTAPTSSRSEMARIAVSRKIS